MMSNYNQRQSILGQLYNIVSPTRTQRTKTLDSFQGAFNKEQETKNQTIEKTKNVLKIFENILQQTFCETITTNRNYRIEPWYRDGEL